MKHDIKLVAVDINGTFVHSDYSYDYPRFRRILARMPEETVHFILDFCQKYPDISVVLCGADSAYCERGAVSPDFYALTGIYCHRLKWTDDLKQVKDRILKFALTVPDEKTVFYHDLLQEKLCGRAEPTSSGHGSIDLILPGCHKASGLKRLIRRWNLSPRQCAAFGDGGNDVEMLRYCGFSFAMANAPQEVKAAAKDTCPSNEEDGVLVTLEKLFP